MESHHASVEESQEDYVSSCLKGWGNRLDAAINFRLLLKEDRARGLYVKHDFRPMLLRTAKDEADYYSKMFQIGYYNINEIRAFRGENLIPESEGGNKRFVNSNMVDIKLAGKPKPEGQQPQPKGEAGRPEKSSRLEYYMNGVHES